MDDSSGPDRDFDEDLDLGTVIARRTFEDAADPARRVAVCVGQPKRRKEEGVWVWICPYQIRGIGDRRVDGARGEDSLQALEVALTSIRATLLATGRQLYWVDPEIGIGISAHIPWAFGREVQEALTEMLEDEITRVVHGRRKRPL